MVNDTESGLLNLFARTLEWDQKRPQTETAPPPAPAPPEAKPVDSEAGDSAGVRAAAAAAGSIPAVRRQPWQLVGDLPSKMIKNLEGTYLDLPRMAVVSA